MTRTWENAPPYPTTAVTPHHKNHGLGERLASKKPQVGGYGREREKNA